MIRSFFLTTYRLGIRLLGGRGLSRMPILGPIHKFLSLRARTYGVPRSVQVFGNTLYLPPRDDLALAVWGAETYEPEITAFFKDRLRPGDVFVDVGANIGYFTLLAAKLVGPEGKVFAFEPDPENAALLRKNVEANGYTNVKVEEKAVSDRPGTVELFRSAYNHGDHCIYDRGGKISELAGLGELDPGSDYDQHAGDDLRRKVEVPAVTLDGYFPEGSRPVSYLKIDVQGAEGLVALGMKGLLGRNPGLTIVSEFWPAGIKMTGREPEEYLRTFEEAGFQISEIEKDGLRSTTAAELAGKYNPRNNQGCNFVCARPAL